MTHDEFGIEKSRMLNDPKSPRDPFVVVEQDGDKLCAHLNDFIDLQESPAGFGDTQTEAISNLLLDLKYRCQQPMWFGWGAPAGLCGSQAYCSGVHPNTLSMLLIRQIARCPKHGGFDLPAAAALISYYRTNLEKDGR